MERNQPAATRRRETAQATWGLFFGLGLLLFAGGLFGTVLGVRAELLKKPTAVSGAISAAYYCGFLLGARLALQSLARVGHIRVYAALASLLSAAMIAVGLTDASVWWMALRFVTGLCLAGQYVVAESWLNDLAHNENRGRLLAIYSLVTTGAFGLGQVMLFAMDPRLITAFAVSSIVASLAVAPVALSEAAAAPVVGATEHISLRELARSVPTGVLSCAIVGAAHGALVGLAALYATRVGMSEARTALFVAAPSIGGMVLQYPISAAADELDRRAVGLVAAIVTVGLALALVAGPSDSPYTIAVIGLLGAFTFPLYSIAAAYTNDWIEPEHVNAAASQLITLYGIGAVIGPLGASACMVAFGTDGFYWALIGLHGALAAFFVYRIAVWHAPPMKLPAHELSLAARVFFVPATIVTVGRGGRRRSTTDADGPASSD